MNLVTIHCPHCGRELSIPEDAGDIVCMFCAQPINARAIFLASMPPEPDSDLSDTELTDPETLLSDELFADWFKSDNFTVAKYPEEYERYLEQFRPALNAFRLNARSDPDAPEKFAALLFRKFQDKFQSLKQKRQDTFPFRLTITALTIPSILSLQSTEAEHAADRFLEQWNAAFPKEHLGKATYDQILGGFKHKFCYITTAVCRSLGREDDGTGDRRFRPRGHGIPSHLGRLSFSPVGLHPRRTAGRLCRRLRENGPLPRAQMAFAPPVRKIKH